MIRYYHLLPLFVISLFISLIFPQDLPLLEFELKDQFDQKYTNKDFRGLPCILVGSDRGGSKYNISWSEAIQDSLEVYGLQDSVQFLALANLNGIPRFFRGLVKSKFPKEGAHSILLDWEGTFAESYRFTPGMSNIILFDKYGYQIYRIDVQEINALKLNNFLEKLYTLF